MKDMMKCIRRNKTRMKSLKLNHDLGRDLQGRVHRRWWKLEYEYFAEGEVVEGRLEYDEG
jgi:YD repeat-containing protein